MRHNIIAEVISNVVQFSSLRENGGDAGHCWDSIRKFVLPEMFSTKWDPIARSKFIQQLLFKEKVPFKEYLMLRSINIVQKSITQMPVENERTRQLRELVMNLHSNGQLRLTFADFIHEILDSFSKFVDVERLATNLLLVACRNSSSNPPDNDLLIHLFERKMDFNTLNDSNFKDVLQCILRSKLLVDGPIAGRITKALLDSNLDTEKANLLWQYIVSHLHDIASEPVAKIVQHLARKGLSSENALYTIQFRPISSAAKFNYFLKICETLINSGARLNPLPESNEEPFLHQVIDCWEKCLEKPCLLQFITLCIEHGADPKAKGFLRKDLLQTVCSTYNAEDLCHIIELLCDFVDVNSVSWRGQNNLSLLLSTGPIPWNYVYEAVKVLLRKGIDVNHLNVHSQNILHLLVKIGLKHDVKGCCKYGVLRRLNQLLKFWQLLHLLVDSGVNVDHSDIKGYTPLRELIYSLSLFHGFWAMNLCSNCSNEYFGEKNPEIIKNVGFITHFTGPLKFLARLLEANAKTDILTDNGYENVLFYVCTFYKADELMALVKLLCESGVDVNALREVINENTRKRRRENIAQALRRIDLLSDECVANKEIVAILMQYGLKEVQ